MKAPPNLRTTLTLALALATGGCSSSLPVTPVAGDENTNDASQNTAVGFDPGVEVPDLADVVVAGAKIPQAGDASALSVVFVAFATALPADDADGSGTPLVSRAPVPADANGAPDVFLAVVDAGGGASFGQLFLNTYQHPRCVQCHGFHVAGDRPNPGHTGGFDPNNGNCTDCHNSSVRGLEGVTWEAPPPRFDFRGKDAEQICNEIQANIDGDLVEHLKTDDKILWALESGTIPFGGQVASGGTAPLTRQEWISRIDRWEAGGFQCESGGEVLDVALVSVTSGGATGDGASGRPTLTFVPRSGFNPADPVNTSPAGFVHVAFESAATDLIAGVTSPNRDVFRSTFQVDVAADGSVSVAHAGTLLVSRTEASSVVGGDADSGTPAMSADGLLVAFESGASDLVGGFVDGNGFAGDVYLRDLARGLTLLASAARGATADGGNGGSSSPSISPTGGIVAFDSIASDLVADDTNAARDVFYNRLAPSGTPLEGVVRASVMTGGGEATGGPSSHPSVVAVQVAAGAGAVPKGIAPPLEIHSPLIAFESEKVDLAPGRGAAASNIYLHDARGGGTTTLLTPGANGDSIGGRFSPNGNTVAFETLASNVDEVRARDRNAVSDVAIADLRDLLVGGELVVERVSIASEGTDGDAASIAGAIGSFRDASGNFADGSFVGYITQATNLGAADSTQLVLVLVNGRPRCDINAPARVDTGADAAFDGTGSTDDDPGDTVESFAWDFGDGSTAAGANVSHAYVQPGEYDVTLTVTDSRGGSSPCVSAISVNTPPICDIAFIQSPGGVGKDVFAFDATGSIDLDSIDAIESYAWDFGDGSSSTLPAVDHAYATVASFTVTLTVTDTRGVASTCSVDVTAGNLKPLCVASFDPQTHTGCTVSFDGSASADQDGDGISELRWNFGDGTAEVIGAAVLHSFTAPGTYTVTLTVTDGGVPSAFESCSADIDVAPTWEEIFPLFQDAGCAGTSCHDGSSFPTMIDESDTYCTLVGGGSSCAATLVPIGGSASPDTTGLLSAMLGNCGLTFAMGNVSDMELLREWIRRGAVRDCVGGSPRSTNDVCP